MLPCTEYRARQSCPTASHCTEYRARQSYPTASYRKKMATIAEFLDENRMPNPLTTEPPSHLILQDLLRQANELLEKSSGELRGRITDNFYAPVSQLEEQFYSGDNFQRIFYIDSFRRANDLPPLFNKADPFPSRDTLTGAISHGFEMARLTFASYQQLGKLGGENLANLGKVGKLGKESMEASMQEKFEKTQSYTHRIIDVLESTYMS